MSNKDYKKIVLEKLLKKYNNRIARNTNTNRRIILKPQEAYENYADNNADIAEKQNLDEAVQTLSDLGAVTASYLKFSTDIEKIYLCEDNTEVIYGYLRDEYGIIPQSAISQKAKVLLEQYRFSGELVQHYADTIQYQMEDPRILMDLCRIEANLKMLDFLEKNEEDLYVREASVLVYGDSKWFEQNNCDEVCNIIRESLQMPREESERNDEALAHYHVTPTEQEIMIKGDWKVEWDDYILETAKLKGGIAISSNDVKNIRRITVRASDLMTIENKTSYRRMDAAHTVMMYLGGFASRPQIDFLRKVMGDNPDICCYHFGDIDVGGFLIHRHLCRTTGTDFRLYGMGIEQFEDERFCLCIKELTDNDISRMERLSEEEAYRDVIGYMREHRVKLEQEVVSYYLGKRRSRQ